MQIVIFNGNCENLDTAHTVRSKVDEGTRRVANVPSILYGTEVRRVGALPKPRDQSRGPSVVTAGSSRRRRSHAGP